MSDNNLYLQYINEVCEQLNQRKFKTKDEALEYFNNIKDEYISNLEIALDQIFDDFCDENDLVWEEDLEDD